MNEPGLAVTRRDQRNSKRYIQLSFLWAVVYVACTFTLAFELVASVPLRWLLAFLPSAFAALSATAYWRYLHGMDELLRAIELKALALAITAGWIVWPTMELLENGLKLDVDVPVVMLVMTGFYVYGLFRGRLAHL
jgi:hypothetical protein